MNNHPNYIAALSCMQPRSNLLRVAGKVKRGIVKLQRWVRANERLLIVAASSCIMSVSHTALRPVLPVFAKVRCSRLLLIACQAHHAYRTPEFVSDAMHLSQSSTRMKLVSACDMHLALLLATLPTTTSSQHSCPLSRPLEACPEESLFACSRYVCAP